MFTAHIRPINRVWTKSIHTTLCNQFKDYYGILGIPKSANQGDIKKAYYELAKTHHPDTNKDKSSSVKFQEISEAYQILSDDAKRRAYDTTIGSRGAYSSSFYSDSTGRAQPRRTTTEPINMRHMQYVYKTLNREEMEEPKYEFAADHNYPNSSFNRFEYQRRWDHTTNRYVYTKRSKSDIRSYDQKMQQGERILRMCIFVVMGGVMFYIVSYKYLVRNIANQAHRKDPD